MYVVYRDNLKSLYVCPQPVNRQSVRRRGKDEVTVGDDDRLSLL